MRHADGINSVDNGSRNLRAQAREAFLNRLTPNVATDAPNDEPWRIELGEWMTDEKHDALLDYTFGKILALGRGASRWLEEYSPDDDTGLSYTCTICNHHESHDKLGNVAEARMVRHVNGHGRATVPSNTKIHRRNLNEEPPF